MRILVATNETQGKRKNDFCWTQEGELVIMAFECDTDKNNVDGTCGCGRSMSGLTTAKATTTFKVVDLPCYKEVNVLNKIRAHYTKNWRMKRKDAIEYAKEMLEELNSIAYKFPVGKVLEKRGDVIQVREL